jgi:hypothetical protein
MELSRALTRQLVASDVAVYLNSVKDWRQRWTKDGLPGLYEEHDSGRLSSWHETHRPAWRDLAY